MNDQYDDYYDCDEDKHSDVLLARLTSKMSYFTERSKKAFNQKCKNTGTFKNNEKFQKLFNKKGSYIRDNYYELYETMRAIKYSKINFLTVTKLIYDTDSIKRNVMARIIDLQFLMIIKGNKIPTVDKHLHGISLTEFGNGVLVTMNFIWQEIQHELSSVDLKVPLTDLDTSLDAVISRIDYLE